MTAQSITANEGISLDGTLTVNGTLDAHKITGGTLNIVLPETAGASPIIKADAENVTLTLDLKNVKSKNAQEYRLTNSKDGYTVSGDYGKYAFSADGNFANYRTDKDALILPTLGKTRTAHCGLCGYRAARKLRLTTCARRKFMFLLRKKARQKSLKCRTTTRLPTL